MKGTSLCKAWCMVFLVLIFGSCFVFCVAIKNGFTKFGVIMFCTGPCGYFWAILWVHDVFNEANEGWAKEKDEEMHKKRVEKAEEHDQRGWFDLIFLLSEIVLIILYAYFTEYGDGVHPASEGLIMKEKVEGEEAIINLTQANKVQQYYPVFQDVHVMIYVGFGFLMVFLRSHSWTSVGYNFIIAAWVCQLTILLAGVFH